VAIAALAAAFRAWQNRAPAPWVERLELGAVLVILVTGAGGLGLLFGGSGPHEALHFVYAVLAIGGLPIADSLARHASARRRAAVTLAAALVVFVLIIRLIQTG